MFQHVRNDDNVPGFYYTCVVENVELRDYKFGNEFKFNVVPNSNGTERQIDLWEQFFSHSQVTVLKGQDLELFCVVSG